MRIAVIFFGFLCGILLFFFAGWRFILGTSTTLLRFTGQSAVLEADGFAFRVNNKYYGLVNVHRFFDSPFFAWLFLLGVIVLFGLAIRYLFKKDIGE